MSFPGLFELGADDSRQTRQTWPCHDRRLRPCASRCTSGYARLDDAWPGLYHAVTTGESGYRHTVGESLWDTLVAGNSSVSRSISLTVVGNLVPRSDLRSRTHHRTCGGYGGEAATFWEIFWNTAPGCEARSWNSRRLLRAPRNGSTSGDWADASTFFPRASLAVPGGADMYVLAQVLHNWPDAEAQVLSRVASCEIWTEHRNW